MCCHPKDCFHMHCNKIHTVDICPDLNLCQDYHCSNRHSKLRPRCCFEGAACQKSTCDFLHPYNREVASPAKRSQAAAQRQGPQAVLPAAHQSPITKVTEFGPQDLNMAGQELQDALKQLSCHQVIVKLPNLCHAIHKQHTICHAA